MEVAKGMQKEGVKGGMDPSIGMVEEDTIGMDGLEFELVLR